MVSPPVAGLAFDDEGQDPWRSRLQKYYDRVLRIVRIRLGARATETLDSRDTLERTIRDAVNSLERTERGVEASLIQWLSRLVERQILAAADYHGAQELPRGATAGEDEPNLVEQCIQRLPEKYRELILLRNYAGASWETVAEETGHPDAAAARAMHARAMRELAKLVREAGGR